MEKKQYQYEGLKWLFELEFLNNPQVINTIKFNIMVVSNRIKEVELLIYRENKTMLVLVDLTWIGRKFFKDRIFTEIHEVLTQLLPSFKFRVTDDPKIMELAVERVKKALTGGSNEKTTNDGSSSVQPNAELENRSSDGSESGSKESPSPGDEKPPETGEELRPGVSPDDSKKE